MKFKEELQKIGKVVGLWLLGKLKDIWEEKLKVMLHEQIQSLVHEAVDEISKLRDSVEYELKRDEIYDKIFKKVELPLLLKPFKWLIKKLLKEEIDKRTTSALEKIKNAI